MLGLPVAPWHDLGEFLEFDWTEKLGLIHLFVLRAYSNYPTPWVKDRHRRRICYSRGTRHDMPILLSRVFGTARCLLIYSELARTFLTRKRGVIILASTWSWVNLPLDPIVYINCTIRITTTRTFPPAACLHSLITRLVLSMWNRIYSGYVSYSIGDQILWSGPGLRAAVGEGHVKHSFEILEAFRTDFIWFPRSVQELSIKKRVCS